MRLALPSRVAENDEGRMMNRVCCPRGSIAVLLCALLAATTCVTAVEPRFCAHLDEIPAQAELGDSVGSSVDIWQDYLVVGAPLDDADTLTDAGSAYVYQRHLDGTWMFVTQLLGTAPGIDDLFGHSVAISNDVIVVGAPGAPSPNGVGSGLVYVFHRDEGGLDAWGLVQTLSPGPDSIDSAGELGASVDLDGDILIVGAPGELNGEARVYQRDEGGLDNWGLLRKITVTDGALLDRFGESVSLDTDLALVGAPEHDEGGTDAGAAYLFLRRAGGTNNWGLVKKFVASDQDADRWFGASCDLELNRVVLGTRADQIYVFDRDEGGENNWGEAAIVCCTAHVGFASGGVSLLGNSIVVGSPDDLGGSGSVQLLARDQGGPNMWGEVTTITGPLNTPGFGRSVAYDLAGIGVGSTSDLTATTGSVQFMVYCDHQLELSPPFPGIVGQNIIEVRNCTPGEDVFLGYSLARGEFHIPGCPTEDGELNMPRLVAFKTANEDGVVRFGVTTPQRAEGLRIYLQAVEPGACRSSDAIEHIPRSAGPYVAYVDADAGPNGDGLSWDEALPSVEAALDLARTFPIGEVWVAGGVYSASLSLNRNIELYGGFVGDEDQREDRDPVANVTLLRGTIHVFAGDGTVVIDGFEIRRAIDVTSGNFTLRNAEVTREPVSIGPNAGRAVSIEDTAFRNCAPGAMSIASPTRLRRCSFFGNMRNEAGGAAWLTDDAVFIDCIFGANQAIGGAEPALGGAVYVEFGVAEFYNCVFKVNEAVPGSKGSAGGAITVEEGQAQTWISNCLFVGNTADTFSAVAAGINTLMFNSIVWNNIGTGVIGWRVEVWYSAVEGGRGGRGNIDGDPLFIDPDADNYRLQPGSPCIDAAANDALRENIPFDLDGRRRLFDDPDTPDTGYGARPIVDMGPYEFSGN